MRAAASGFKGLSVSIKSNPSNQWKGSIMENSNEINGRRNFITSVGLGFGLIAASIGKANAKPCAGARFEIYPSGSKWRWRLYAANGEQIAEHHQPYDSYQACEYGIRAVQRAHNAPVLDKDSC